MISLAHPTLNDLAAPEFIRIAKRAGYVAANLRIVGFGPSIFTADAAPADIFDQPGLFDATASALADTGITLLDIEVIRIGPETRGAEYRPLFDAGARLGARYAVAIAMDPDESRVTERFGELCAEARAYGLRLVLEFMARSEVRTLDAARRIVTASGNGGIMIDALHFYRSGARPSDLAGLDPALFPYMQINDVEGFDALRSAPVDNTVGWKKVLPGFGDLALSELLRALPAGIPISVEVPGPPDASAEEAERYARRAYEATRAVVESLAAHTS